MSSEKKREVTFPATITLRANCCSDLPRWIRNGLNPKSVALSNAHTEAGPAISISIIGEFSYDFDLNRNTIKVKRYFAGEEHNSYKYGQQGIIVTCNTCQHVTFHYYNGSDWHTCWDHGEFRNKVTINWANDLPADKRTWRNVESIRYCVSRNCYGFDDRTVNCFGSLPDKLLTCCTYRDENPDDGRVNLGLIADFWDIYLDTYGIYRKNDRFHREFSMWSAKMANAYHCALMGVHEQREHSLEKIRTIREQIELLAKASYDAAHIIHGFKDVDLSDGKAARSRKLQEARKMLEKAREEAGYCPINYEKATPAKA